MQFWCVYVCSEGWEQESQSSGVLVCGLVQFLPAGMFDYKLRVYMVKDGELNTQSSLALRVSWSSNPNTNQVGGNHHGEESYLWKLFIHRV